MNEVTEITEDIEIIGPGRLLSDARKSKNLSVEQVAEKLNFRDGLVADIEADNFDRTLPSTFNRGYLKSYAKLVDVQEEDVLSSFEMLGVAEKQSTEMQSFSKITEKQAQTRSLMWLSYLILAVLVGSTLVWFYQYQTSISEKAIELDAKVESTTDTIQPPNKSVTSGDVFPKNDVTSNVSVANDELNGSNQENTSIALKAEPSAPVDETLDSSSTELSSLNEVGAETQVTDVVEQSALGVNQAVTQVIESEPVIVENTAIFTFSGDCWVNIYDASGERVAWGVKKTDYVMTVKGQAPFSVTLGKPELVTINFAGQLVDMSQFSAGNIAKFTLPLESE